MEKSIWLMSWVSRPFIQRNEVNVFHPKRFKCLAGALTKTPNLYLKVFLSKKLVQSQQNLILTVLFIHSNSKGFLPSSVISFPHQQRLWISRYLNNSSLWICSENILWQIWSLCLLNSYWIENDTSLPKDHAFSNAFQKTLAFLLSLLFNHVSKHMSCLKLDWFGLSSFFNSVFNQLSINFRSHPTLCIDLQELHPWMILMLFSKLVECGLPHLGLPKGFSEFL